MTQQHARATRARGRRAIAHVVCNKSFIDSKRDRTQPFVVSAHLMFRTHASHAAFSRGFQRANAGFFFDFPKSERTPRTSENVSAHARMTFGLAT
jgi:F420-dependent methylenetetrahydromethanopterin dehydrogenase